MEIHTYINPQYPLPDSDQGTSPKERSCLVCGDMFKPSARCVWTVWKSNDHTQYSNLIGYVCDVCALCPGDRYPEMLRQHADNIDGWITSGSEHGERAVLLHELADRMRQYANEPITVVAHDELCPIVGI